MSSTKYNSKKDNVIGKGTPAKTPITRDPKLYAGTLVYGDDGNLYFSNGEEWRTTSEDLIRKPVALQPRNPREQAMLRLTAFSAAANSGLHQTGVTYEVYNTLEEFTNNNRKITGATWLDNTATITCAKLHNLEIGETYQADIKDIRSSTNTSGQPNNGYNLLNATVTASDTTKFQYTLNVDPGNFIFTNKANITILPKDSFKFYLDDADPTNDIGATGSSKDLGLNYFYTREDYGANTDFYWRAKYGGGPIGSNTLTQESRWSDIARQTFPKLIETPQIANDSDVNGQIVYNLRSDIEPKRSCIELTPFESAFSSEGVSLFSTIWTIEDISTLVSFAAVNVNIVSNSINISEHSFVTGDKVSVDGLLEFYVIAVDLNNIKMADSYSNAIAGIYLNVVDDLGFDVGSHTLEKIAATITVDYNFDDPDGSKYLYLNDLISLYDLDPDLTYRIKAKYTAVYNGDSYESLYSDYREFVLPDIYSIKLVYNLQTSTNNRIYITFVPQENEDITIHWGYGQTTEYTYNANDFTNQNRKQLFFDYNNIPGFIASQPITVRISGKLKAFGPTSSSYISTKDSNKNITSVISLGLEGSTLEDLSYAFTNASKLTQLPTIIPPSVTNIEAMFLSIGTGTLDENISSWDTTNITNMSKVFQNAYNFNQDLSSWNTSNVTNMSYMFVMAQKFNNKNNSLTSWDTISVTNMSSMFSGASAFNQDISSWHTDYVINMSYMFNNATLFNQDISLWNVSSVTTMRYMFSGASAFNQDISSWEVSSVTDMSYMFAGTQAFNSTLPWTNLSSLQNVEGMFSNSNFNQEITWDLPNVTNLQKMFYGANTFNQDINLTLSNDSEDTINASYMFFGTKLFNKLPDINTDRITNMSYMFANSQMFNQDISSLSFENVINLSHMFEGAKAFNNDGADWKEATFTNAEDMSFMFSKTSVFNTNLEKWHVEKVENFTSMFDSAAKFNNILYWYLGTDANMNINMSKMFASTPVFNQDLFNSTQQYNGTWDTSRVTNMSGMFDGAKSFTGAGGSIGNWDVSNVTNLSFMFRNAVVFNGNITPWNSGGELSKVTTVESMFEGAALFNNNTTGALWNQAGTPALPLCINFKAMFKGATKFKADIKNWSISKDQNNAGNIDMSYMFNEATGFNLDISSWNTSKVISIARMFYGASAFKNGGNSLNGWDVSNVTSMDYTFSGTPYNSELNDWDVSYVTNFNGIFRDSEFNKPISSWEIGLNVSSNAKINCSQMFYGSKFNQAIGNWNVSKVDNMSSMFARCPFNQDISSWHTDNVTNMDSMFELNTSFASDIGDWNVSKVTNMSNMFQNATSFNSALNAWVVSNVTDMSGMFAGASNFNKSLGGWNLTSIVPETGMLNMFDGATAFGAFNVKPNSTIEYTGYYLTTLTAWSNSSNNNIPRDVNIGVKSIPVTSAYTAKEKTLTDGKNWKFIR